MNTTFETTPPAYKRAIRVVALGMPLVTGMFFFFVLTGINGYRGGWLWAPLIVVPPLALLGWFGWGPARGRAVATSFLGLLGIAFGVWLSQEAIISDGRLKAEFDSLAMPPGFELVSDERGGVPMCFDVCTNHTRTFLAPGSPEQLQASISQALHGERFVVGAWKPYYRDAILRGHRGRLGISVVVADWRFQDGRNTQLPPGQTLVTVTLDTHSGNPL